MTTITASWIEHPGFYIREEMEARDWSQRDLAFILGIPEQAVNMILSGKRGISPDMALALAEAFDVASDFFANLQKTYDLSRAKAPDPSVAMRGMMQSKYPVREMINRGWLTQSDTSLLETQLVRFFEVASADEIPYLAHAAKKSRYDETEVSAPQLAWLYRVRQLAKGVAAIEYAEKKLRAALRDLEALLLTPQDVRHVPRILAECGVRLIFVEKLPKAQIDGVCFWIDDKSPVIGMSLQRDTIDNFWFVLRHEIEHVLNGDGRTKEIIDVALTGENASANNPNLPTEERVANAAAADFCAPAAKLDSFMIRKKPFYYEKDVVAFAQMHYRHPGLVVGQMQYRMQRYDYLHRHLAKVRQFVLPGAIADGWGQVIPTSL